MNFGPSQDFLDCLGWTLIHFFWQGLVIAALAAVALRFLRRHSADARYLAACFALLLMAAAPVATFYSLNRTEEIPIVKFSVQIFDAPDTTVELPRPTATPPKAALAVAPKPIAHKNTFSELLEAFLPWLVVAWSLGVLALSCRLFAGWLFIQKLCRSANLIDPLQARMKLLAARIGVSRPIRLLQSACVEVPAVIGWLRPVILLPASCLIGLTPAQLESILAHELAHIRRHDYLVNLLQNVVETLLFYHPAVWWISRRIRAEREHCCDDLAVKTCGDAAAYARALATLEELRPAPAPFALAASGASLLDRIRRLAGQPERSAVRPAWPVAGVIALLLLALLAAALRNNPASAEPAAEAPHTNQNVSLVASTNLVTSSNTNLLAAPAADAAGTSGPTVTVAVDKSGRYYYQDRIVSEAELKLAVADEAKKSSQPLKLVLLAGQDTASSNIVHLTDLARGLGISNVVLQTVPGQITNRVDFKDLLGKSGAAVMPGQYTTLVDPDTVLPEVRKKLDQQDKSYQGLLRGASTNQNSIQRSNDQPLPEINIKTKWAEIDVAKIGTNSATWPFNDGDSQNLKSLPGTFSFSEFLILKSTNAADPNQFIYLHNQTNSGSLSFQLSDTRYQSMLKKFEQQDGVDILTAPEVTTESGRQCQIQAVDINNILIGGPVSDRADSRRNFTNMPMPFGPVLDVIPHVSSDRRKIELTIVASVTEFVGYEDPATVTNNHGKRMPKDWAIPHFRVRQFKANLAVENAQTMALGSSLVPIAQIAKPKKYVLGLFHSKATTNTINKTLFLLITPTLINNDGTRFVPPPVRTNAANPSSGRDAIVAKLNRLHLSSVEYQKLPLSEIVDNLSYLAKRLDPEKTGINFLLNREPLPPATPALTEFESDARLATISLSPALNDVSFADLLEAIVKTSDVPIRYSVNDYAVVFSLRDTNEPPPLEIRTFHLNEDAFFRKIGVPLTNEARTGLKFPPLAESDHFYRAVIEFFNSTGADFDTNRPANRTKTFVYTSRHSLMAVRATHNDLRWIEDTLNQLHLTAPMESQTKPPLAESEAAVSRTNFARTNFVYTSKGRQAIISKLDKIHLDEIHYDGIHLGDLINDLSRRVKALDTNGTGINFFVSRESPSAAYPAAGTIDPATGLPMPALPTDLVDLRTVVVTINPALENIRLADVLDAITKCSDTPIKYSILDYAVVFSLRTPEPIPLEIRTFHVDPNTFRSGLESVSGPTNGNITTNSGSGAGIKFVTSNSNSTDALQVSIREFFAAVGVDFSTNNPANIGKAFAWNQRKGILTVRTTASDLDMLAAAIENLNLQPPMINFKVKVAQVAQQDIGAPGFNWTLGNYQFSNTLTASNRISLTLKNPLSAPALGTISKILTDTEVQVALQTLDLRDGVEFFTTPEITAESGRQVHIETDTIKTNRNHPATGPTIDLLPFVSADGFSIELTVTPTIQEFIGYDGPGTVKTDMEGNPRGYQSLPHFRVRQYTNHVTLFDGQTAVFGGAIIQSPEKQAAGSSSNAPILRTNTMIFITATIVNPDGTPYHSAADRASFQSNVAASHAFPSSLPLPGSHSAK